MCGSPAVTLECMSPSYYGAAPSNPMNQLDVDPSLRRDILEQLGQAVTLLIPIRRRVVLAVLPRHLPRNCIHQTSRDLSRHRSLGDILAV